MIPRGIKNNNPGNIRISEVNWIGKITPSPDPEFECFREMQYGVRAAGKIFLNYHRSDGLSTIAQFINRWAPPADTNPTDAYIDFVATDCGVDPNNQYDVSNPENLSKLLDSVFRFENGGSYVSQDDLKKGVELAV